MEFTKDYYEDDLDTQKDRYLTFSVGKESYGIEIGHVTEIIGLQTITEIPQLPSYIKGIINLRGKIIPVMDIRLRFQMEQRSYTNRTCVIIVDIRDISIGIIVDSVSEVLSITEENILEVPSRNKSMYNRFIRRIGKVENEVKLLLDCEKLLSEEQINEITGEIL